MLDFLKAIRCRYPEAKRIYVVMDNLSTHKTPTILQWCRHNQVSPVFTATNASWMNRLECHLTAAHYFYKRAPKDTVVVCFDELGPVQIKPHAGSSWAPRKHPVRHRATYTRRGGVSYFFGAYNVHEDILWMHHKRKKHATVVLDFLKAIRCRYPEAKRIYVVMDNLSTHKTPTILQWCRHNQVSPVFTATNASWMNRLECHLTAAHYFVIKNSDLTTIEMLASACRST